MQERKPLLAQISTQHARDQETARSCLMLILSGMRYLARQGLAFRGHTEDEGNFVQLLKLSTETNHSLKTWLEKYQSYTSPAIQNEILCVMAETVLNDIDKDIKSSQPSVFSIVVDGTRDITGIEQESICIRYVNENLEPIKIFCGLYEAKSTTGEDISNIILEALHDHHLSLEMLRGQTYDGAGNMSGIYNGTQAKIRQKQPLALFVHCIAHCINLVTETSVGASLVVRDAIDMVNEVGVLSARSGKFQNLFKTASSDHYNKTTSLKPLCATRWTVRVKAICSVIDQYEAMLEALEEMADGIGDSSIKASGILQKFKRGNTFLSMIIALEVLKPLEMLNTVLQARHKTISGMKQAVASVKLGFTEKRSEEEFQIIFAKANKNVSELDLEDISAPRKRNVPKRYTGPATPFQPSSVEEFFKLEYFKVLDMACTQLCDRIDQEGLQIYEKLEECLLSGRVNDTLNYPEIDIECLRVQLPMFRHQYQYSSLDSATSVFRSLAPEVRSLFRQVEIILRLMLVIPVTSCESERSFSALRRLKNWLRSSMTQQRLNHVAVCISNSYN